MRIPCCLLIFSLILATVPVLASEPADRVRLVFETDVQPVLAKKCGNCHGAKSRKGDLNLSTMAGLRRGGESGEVLIDKNLDESLLWIMIAGGDMPPEGQPRLTGKERQLIRKWLETGAHSKEPAPSGKRTLTQHDILPIVLLRCVTCHGARRRDGGGDLRSPALMKKGGESGPALVAGKPDESLMIQRIESEACPPRELLLKFFVRRPPQAEVQKLREWIAAGAPEVDVAPDIATTEPDPLVSDEDRQHWAFQPPRKPEDGNSIDEFILAKLKQRGLTFAPEADRDTLIRRVYLDLIGMPPSLGEWTKWGSSDADGDSKMINQLLDSPHYGERWGRYWLDVAGYADSEGGVSADPVRKVAWKYRDYVIRAFNEDKPYDRFLIEQIAGDELIDHANSPEITDEMVQNLIATGFLRMGIDQTGSRTMNFVPERLGVIGDAITVLGSGVMGLTLGCAKCHSHKYDPIPHRDYYRFKAIFQGAFDEHDWLTFRNRTLSVDVAERRARVAKINPPLTSRIRKLESQRKQAVSDLKLAMLRELYPDQPETDRSETLRALRIADNNRTQPQRILVEKLQNAEFHFDSLTKAELPDPVRAATRAVSSLENEIAELTRQLEPPLTIRAVWDRGEPSPTYILRRGEHDKPARLVGPGVPSVLTDGRTPFDYAPPFPGGTLKTGRRLAFARWLTQPQHPLTARVFVNRVWYHHFGKGLVKSLENFGVKGDRPSHPKLLDWLAVEFVRQKWSVKQLHRLMMTSRTYRQSSRISPKLRDLDPQNRLLSRMPLRRMNAEALRDSLLAVAGKLERSGGGPPDTIRVDRNGLVSVNPTPKGKWRRSVYLQYRRTEVPSMMATFDYPEMGPNCLSRNVSTVSPQSLMLMNNRHVRELASAFAERVAQLASPEGELNLQAAVQAVYRLALSRNPTDGESELGVRIVTKLQEEWQGDSLAALETYCHTILNSGAFLYVD